MSAFWNCKRLKSVTIPSNVDTIGLRAFEGCYSLTTVVIEDGVTSLGNEVFLDCVNLTSVSIPASVTSFGADIFAGCDDVVISAPSGSDAAAYAESNGLSWIAPSEKPTLTFAADGKSAKASGDFSGLFARVAIILDNGGVSGLYVTQATINADGTILIPEFMVPGLKVKGVNVSLVPTLADIQSSTPNVKATASKML